MTRYVFSVLLLVFGCLGYRRTTRVDGFEVIRSSKHREVWIQNSLSYYNTISRGSTEVVQSNPKFLRNAMENYFALEKVKNGQTHHAETIYRRLVDELTPHEQKEEGCLSSLAIPSLLLGLLLQREERYDDARTVFEAFSRHLVESGEIDRNCSCSARVLQAHALFEMKQSNPQKAVQLILQAARMDKKVRPVLRWHQFQEAMSSVNGRTQNEQRGQKGQSNNSL